MSESEILLTLKRNQQLFADPRRIALLKQIDKTGSLSQAAKIVGVSYKTAWDAIHEMNQLSLHPLVNSMTGGKGGGGAQLTAYAVRFIQLYDLLTTIQHNAFNILSDDDAPLDNLLAATARLSLQTSARNQLYGTISDVISNTVYSQVIIMLNDQQTVIKVNVTRRSIDRLQLSKNKAVILLIKAPAVAISLTNSLSENSFKATIKQIRQDNIWSELDLSLSDDVVICATKLTQEFQALNLQLNQTVYINIHPENIIIATLV
ncbi:TOBE domain-containing protein [Zophobihabitans entericus]|uniref:TOBE domain-containing protein n=1 Tax=Zophobihabitans entericus TaxID=1635327 RepID=A0A6G9IBY8_9GAMM|nr:TOBE domain-containing protein [Zophobihabitans entericus]QIQ21748.1 TOBE domain-containing protein [Zophobihabitans entericus]